jgi:coproporphyrinogen III oxidase-like Fe-S oxidoreductase
MLGLRLAEGLDAVELERAADRIGSGPALREAIEGERRAGRVARRGDRLVLSSSGWLFADGVASELMASLTRDRRA